MPKYMCHTRTYIYQYVCLNASICGSWKLHCICLYESASWWHDCSCMIAMKNTMTRNRQYGGDSGQRSHLCLSALNVCHCSPTTEFLETVMYLLSDCARFYPQADVNMRTWLFALKLRWTLSNVFGWFLLNCWWDNFNISYIDEQC